MAATSRCTSLRPLCLRRVRLVGDYKHSSRGDDAANSGVFLRRLGHAHATLCPYTRDDELDAPRSGAAGVRVRGGRRRALVSPTLQPARWIRGDRLHRNPANVTPRHDGSCRRNCAGGGSSVLPAHSSSLDPIAPTATPAPPRLSCILSSPLRLMDNR